MVLAHDSLEDARLLYDQATFQGLIPVDELSLCRYMDTCAIALYTVVQKCILAQLLCAVPLEICALISSLGSFDVSDLLDETFTDSWDDSYTQMVRFLFDLDYMVLFIC